MHVICLALVSFAACSSPSESGGSGSGSGYGSGSGSGSDRAKTAPVKPPKIEYDLCHGPWCWVSGRPQGNKLHDVVAVGDQVWAVGEWGTVMHHDGTRWHAETIGDAKLTAIWVRAADDLWVIGEAGFIARRSGTKWTTFPKVDAKLHDVAGGDTDDVWIVGEKGTVLHWDGKALAAVKIGAHKVLYSVAVLAKDNVWIGQMDSVWKWDGKTWKAEEVPGLGLAAFIDIRALSPTDVWAVEDLGIVFHWDGTTWTMSTKQGMAKARDPDEDESIDHTFAAGHRQHGRFSGTATDLWITGGSSAYRWDGKLWRDRGHLPKWMTASTRVGGRLVAVGYGGRIARGMPKQKWIEERTGIDFSVQRMWSDGGGKLVVAGYGEYFGIHGKLATLKDGVLEKTKYDGPAGGLAGRSADDLYASGADGEIRKFDGKTWTKMPTPTKETIRWLALGPPAWAVGDKGTILRLDGAAWASVPSPTTGNLRMVWSASPSLAWAIGEESKAGILLRWDGTAWTIAERFEGEVLNALDGVDATRAWIATSKRILAWDGKAWASAAGGPADARLYRLDALTPTDVWAVGPNTVWQFDGKAWTSDRIGFTPASLLVERDAVWIGGEDGALLRRAR